jgi:hypothetical protein
MDGVEQPQPLRARPGLDGLVDWPTVEGELANAAAASEPQPRVESSRLLGVPRLGIGFDERACPICCRHSLCSLVLLHQQRYHGNDVHIHHIEREPARQEPERVVAAVGATDAPLSASPPQEIDNDQ